MTPASLKSMSFGCGLLATLATLTMPTAHAIDIAGSLEVNLNASTYTTGNPWSNAGAFGGLFNPVGTPKRETVWGAQAVMFDGSDAMRSTFPVTTLAGGASRSVEVWAWQAANRHEETMVGWGRRGDDGRNESFNWGSSNSWGAHGGWGDNADVGWNPGANNNNPGDSDNITGNPTLGSWHHLVYTYNSANTTMSFYDNGALKNSVQLSAYGGGTLALNTHSGYNMLIGSQNDQGNNATPGANAGDNISFSGAIGQVRVHSGVLTPANVTTNFSQEVANYTGFTQTAAALPTGPVNRYTFNNLAGATAGTVITDVVGGQHGTLRGAGATVAGTTGIDLPGGSPATAAYIDLPNGLISSKTNITLEAWVTTQTTQNWGRIMDFGTGTAGEITDVGGSADGTTFLMLSGSNGTSSNQQIERRGAVLPAGSVNGYVHRETTLTVNNGVQQYVALTYDDATDEWRYYRNGILMEVLPDTAALSAIPDVNSWLGRSQFINDANLDGIFNEFRISNYALNGQQVYGNFLAGPDVVNLIPEPSSAAALILVAGSLATRRRRRH